MKQFLNMMFLVALLAMSSRILAQDCAGGHGKGHHAEMMRESLVLNDGQVKQMEAIHQKYKGQIQAIWADEAADHETKIAKMQAIHKAKHTEMMALLTPEQQAKAEALHGQGGHNGFDHGGKGSGSGMHGHGGHGHGRMAEKLEPIAQAQRIKLEAQLSASDKAEIAVLRGKMAELHTQMRAAHVAMRNEHVQGHTPSDAQRAEMDKLRTQKHAIMDQAMAIAERYKTEIQALHDEVKPQIDAILKELEAQHIEHHGANGEGEGHHGKGHGDCKGKGEMHHGPAGHHGDGDHDRMMAKFILMDANGSSQSSTSKAGAGNEAESNGLVVYPNPSTSTNSIRYDLQKSGNVRIELMSIDGKVLKVLQDGSQDAGSHSLDVNLNELAAGTYMYRLTDASGSRVERFSVTK
jgi:hypothetical protein